MAKDKDDVPCNGRAVRPGVDISWAGGLDGRTSHPGALPLSTGEATVEDVLQACIARLEHYQDSSCHRTENAQAIIVLHGVIGNLAQQGK